MEIFGIGPMELLFILLIMLIVLGPKDMVKTGQRLGRMIRNLVRSPTWMAMMNASRELRELPTRFVRESGMENEVTELSKLRNLPSDLLKEAGTTPLVQKIPSPPSNGNVEPDAQMETGEKTKED